MSFANFDAGNGGVPSDQYVDASQQPDYQPAADPTAVVGDAGGNSGTAGDRRDPAMGAGYDYGSGSTGSDSGYTQAADQPDASFTPTTPYDGPAPEMQMPSADPTSVVGDGQRKHADYVSPQDYNDYAVQSDTGPDLTTPQWASDPNSPNWPFPGLDQQDRTARTYGTTRGYADAPEVDFSQTPAPVEGPTQGIPNVSVQDYDTDFKPGSDILPTTRTNFQGEGFPSTMADQPYDIPGLEDDAWARAHADDYPPATGTSPSAFVGDVPLDPSQVVDNRGQYGPGVPDSVMAEFPEDRPPGWEPSGIPAPMPQFTDESGGTDPTAQVGDAPNATAPATADPTASVGDGTSPNFVQNPAGGGWTDDTGVTDAERQAAADTWPNQPIQRPTSELPQAAQNAIQAQRDLTQSMSDFNTTATELGFNPQNVVQSSQDQYQDIIGRFNDYIENQGRSGQDVDPDFIASINGELQDLYTRTTDPTLVQQANDLVVKQMLAETADSANSMVMAQQLGMSAAVFQMQAQQLAIYAADAGNMNMAVNQALAQLQSDPSSLSPAQLKFLDPIISDMGNLQQAWYTANPDYAANLVREALQQQENNTISPFAEVTDVQLNQMFEQKYGYTPDQGSQEDLRRLGQLRTDVATKQTQLGYMATSSEPMAIGWQIMRGAVMADLAITTAVGAPELIPVALGEVATPIALALRAGAFAYGGYQSYQGGKQVVSTVQQQGLKGALTDPELYQGVLEFASGLFTMALGNMVGKGIGGWLAAEGEPLGAVAPYARGPAWLNTAATSRTGQLLRTFAPQIAGETTAAKIANLTLAGFVEGVPEFVPWVPDALHHPMGWMAANIEHQINNVKEDPGGFWNKVVAAVPFTGGADDFSLFVRNFFQQNEVEYQREQGFQRIAQEMDPFVGTKIQFQAATALTSLALGYGLEAARGLNPLDHLDPFATYGDAYQKALQTQPPEQAMLTAFDQTSNGIAWLMFNINPRNPAWSWFHMPGLEAASNWFLSGAGRKNLDYNALLSGAAAFSPGRQSPLDLVLGIAKSRGPGLAAREARYALEAQLPDGPESQQYTQWFWDMAKNYGLADMSAVTNPTQSQAYRHIADNIAQDLISDLGTPNNGSWRWLGQLAADGIRAGNRVNGQDNSTIFTQKVDAMAGAAANRFNPSKINDAAIQKDFAAAQQRFGGRGAVTGNLDNDQLARRVNVGKIETMIGSALRAQAGLPVFTDTTPKISQGLIRRAVENAGLLIEKSYGAIRSGLLASSGVLSLPMQKEGDEAVRILQAGAEGSMFGQNTKVRGAADLNRTGQGGAGGAKFDRTVLGQMVGEHAFVPENLMTPEQPKGPIASLLDATVSARTRDARAALTNEAIQQGNFDRDKHLAAMEQDLINRGEDPFVVASIIDTLRDAPRYFDYEKIARQYDQQAAAAGGPTPGPSPVPPATPAPPAAAATPTGATPPSAPSAPTAPTPLRPPPAAVPAAATAAPWYATAAPNPGQAAAAATTNPFTAIPGTRGQRMQDAFNQWITQPDLTYRDARKQFTGMANNDLMDVGLAVSRQIRATAPAIDPRPNGHMPMVPSRPIVNPDYAGTAQAEADAARNLTVAIGTIRRLDVVNPEIRNADAFRTLGSDAVATLSRNLGIDFSKDTTVGDVLVQLDRKVGDPVPGFSQRVQDIKLTLDAAVAERLAAIAERNQPLGIIPTYDFSDLAADLRDYAVVGGLYAARGALTFSDWSAKMVGRFGNTVVPILGEIWPAVLREATSGKIPETPQPHMVTSVSDLQFASREYLREHGDTIKGMFKAKDSNTLKMIIDTEKQYQTPSIIAASIYWGQGEQAFSDYLRTLPREQMKDAQVGAMMLIDYMDRLTLGNTTTPELMNRLFDHGLNISGLGWYRNYGKYVRYVFRENSVPMLGYTAAASPMTAFEQPLTQGGLMATSNLQHAINAFVANEAGYRLPEGVKAGELNTLRDAAGKRIYPKALGSYIGGFKAVEANEPMGLMKVGNFFPAVSGDPYSLVIDTWMIKALGMIPIDGAVAEAMGYKLGSRKEGGPLNALIDPQGNIVEGMKVELKNGGVSIKRLVNSAQLDNKKIYAFYERIIDQMAVDLSQKYGTEITPSEVQAAVWVGIRDVYDYTNAFNILGEDAVHARLMGNYNPNYTSGKAAGKFANVADFSKSPNYDTYRQRSQEWMAANADRNAQDAALQTPGYDVGANRAVLRQAMDKYGYMTANTPINAQGERVYVPKPAKGEPKPAKGAVPPDAVTYTGQLAAPVIRQPAAAVQTIAEAQEDPVMQNALRNFQGALADAAGGGGAGGMGIVSPSYQVFYYGGQVIRAAGAIGLANIKDTYRILKQEMPNLTSDLFRTMYATAFGIKDRTPTPGLDVTGLAKPRVTLVNNPAYPGGFSPAPNYGQLADTIRAYGQSRQALEKNIKTSAEYLNQRALGNFEYKSALGELAEKMYPFLEFHLNSKRVFLTTAFANPLYVAAITRYVQEQSDEQGRLPIMDHLVANLGKLYTGVDTINYARSLADYIQQVRASGATPAQMVQKAAGHLFAGPDPIARMFPWFDVPAQWATQYGTPQVKGDVNYGGSTNWVGGGLRYLADLYAPDRQRGLARQIAGWVGNPAGAALDAGARVGYRAIGLPYKERDEYKDFQRTYAPEIAADWGWDRQRLMDAVNRPETQDGMALRQEFLKRIDLEAVTHIVPIPWSDTSPGPQLKTAYAAGGTPSIYGGVGYKGKQIQPGELIPGPGDLRYQDITTGDGGYVNPQTGQIVKGYNPELIAKQRANQPHQVTSGDLKVFEDTYGAYDPHTIALAQELYQRTLGQQPYPNGAPSDQPGLIEEAQNSMLGTRRFLEGRYGFNLPPDQQGKKQAESKALGTEISTGFTVSSFLNQDGNFFKTRDAYYVAKDNGNDAERRKLGAALDAIVQSDISVHPESKAYFDAIGWNSGSGTAPAAPKAPAANSAGAGNPAPAGTSSTPRGTGGSAPRSTPRSSGGGSSYRPYTSSSRSSSSSYRYGGGGNAGGTGSQGGGSYQSAGQQRFQREVDNLIPQERDAAMADPTIRAIIEGRQTPANYQEWQAAIQQLHQVTNQALRDYARTIAFTGGTSPSTVRRTGTFNQGDTYQGAGAYQPAGQKGGTQPGRGATVTTTITSRTPAKQQPVSGTPSFGTGTSNNSQKKRPVY